MRLGLADVVARLEAGTLDLGAARALTYSYSVLAGVISDDREQTELLQRVMKLEAALLARRSNGVSGTWRPPATPPTA